MCQVSLYSIVKPYLKIDHFFANIQDAPTSAQNIWTALTTQSEHAQNLALKG